MTKIEGEQVRKLIESTRFGVTEIANAMGTGKTGQTTLSHAMTRGCSAKYFNLIKWAIDHMPDDEPDTSYLDDFGYIMNDVFKGYEKSGCLEAYSYKRTTSLLYFSVGIKDQAYLWASLDGAVNMFNALNKDANICLDSAGGTSETVTFAIGYSY